MGSFIKTFFAALLAIFFAGMILVFGSVVYLLSMAMFSSDENTVEGSVLAITLSEHISDKPMDTPFSLTSLSLMDLDKDYLTTLDVLSAITKAKTDDNIKGIYLRPMEMSLGAAQLEEVRSALLDFRSTGKFIIAYSNAYDQLDYYLSTAADSIYLNPEGQVWWKGLSSQVMFYKGALDKLGVKPQIVRHGRYKSAVEPFTREDMSAENHQQTQELLGSVWGVMLENISKSRPMSVDQLNSAATNLSLPLASDALEHGFVDALLYRDQVSEVLARLTNEEDPKLVGLSEYVSTGVNIHAGSLTSSNKIALIYADGDIVDGAGTKESVGGDALSAKIRQARKDEDVKAVVLRVNSPGGSALAAEVIWREMALTQQEKPVIVSMGNYAASGGYYIAAPADLIFASPTTITGSIGVFALGFDASQAAKEKLGINVESVKTNENSTLMSIFSPMTPAQRGFLERSIEGVYNTFTAHVAQGRNLSPERVEELSAGRVWSGAQANENGLIDGYGSLTAAIYTAADRANIADDFRVDSSQSAANIWSQIIMGTLSSKVSVLESSELMRQAARLKDMAESSKIQALMPYSIDIE